MNVQCYWRYTINASPINVSLRLRLQLERCCRIESFWHKLTHFSD